MDAVPDPRDNRKNSEAPILPQTVAGRCRHRHPGARGRAGTSLPGQQCMPDSVPDRQPVPQALPVRSRDARAVPAFVEYSVKDGPRLPEQDPRMEDAQFRNGTAPFICAAARRFN